MTIGHFTDSQIKKFKITNRKAIYFFDMSDEYDILNIAKTLNKNVLDYNDIKAEYEKFGYENNFYHNGFYYGRNLYLKNIENANFLDLRDDFDVLLNDIEIKNIVGENDIDDLMSSFYDTNLELAINNFAIKNNYDGVLYSDQSEGNEYTSIAILNLDKLF